MATWKCNMWCRNNQETIKDGKRFEWVKEKVKDSLVVGKKYRLQSEHEKTIEKMTLIGLHKNFATFRRKNGTVECFSYQDIFFKTRIC